MKQREFIYNYNYNNKPKFNSEFFNRDNDDLINAIKNVIYSCERDSSFTIKVNNFEVIDDYDEVNRLLWEYENSILNKNNKGKQDSGKNKVINQYDYINIKDSSLILIKIEYFISIVEKKNGLVSETIETYIAIPRIVDGFYFKINGNYFSAMYQVVDASTYNNSASKNAKTQSITFKTAFMATRFYRYKDTLKDIDGNQIQCTYFVANMFKKSLLAIKYIIAKMGYTESLKFLHLDGIFIMNNIDKVNKDENYIFPLKDRTDIFVVANKFIYNNIQIAQSYVYTLCKVINSMNDYPYGKFFYRDTWIESLGSEFVQKNVNVYDKGVSILESLEFIYDIGTKMDLKLSEEDKGDMCRVIRWIMYEFNALRSKDNLDITTKKVRWAEYIACYYANKISLGIYRISDKGDKADLKTIKKAIQIPPMYLINTISKSQLINYKSSVNDLDSITALKYTYKGISGIGEKANAIPNAYRNVNPSHLGRIDIDSSSNSDPGTSGGLVPLVKLYDGHFSEYEEPSTWESSLAKVIDAYNSMVTKVDMIRLIDTTGYKNTKVNNVNVINDCISINKSLIQFPMIVERDAEYINGVDIFGDGYMFYINE